MKKRLISLLLVTLFTVASTASDAAGETLDCCVCGVEEAKSSLTIVPWNEEGKTRNPGGKTILMYTARTIIEGQTFVANLSSEGGINIIIMPM